MTFAAVGTTVYQGGTLSSFTPSINPTAVGNIFVAFVLVESNTASCTGITGGNCTWTQIDNFLGTAKAYREQVFLGTATATGAAAISGTLSTSVFATIDLQQFSTSLGGVSLDVAGHLDNVSTNTCPSLTPAGSGELYAYHGWQAGSGTAGSTSGYTYFIDGNTDGMCYNPACTASAQAPAFGDTNLRMGTAVLLKEGAAAAPSAPSWQQGIRVQYPDWGQEDNFAGSIIASPSQFIQATPLTGIMSFGSSVWNPPAVNPAMATLTDAFASIDSTKWTSSGPVSATSNQLVVSLPSGTAQYAGVTSTGLYDLTGSYIFTQLVNAGNQALVSLEAYPMQLIPSANNSLSWLVSGGNISPFYKLAGTNTFGPSITYVPTTHQWFRIRESGGTTFWDTSADCVNWTNQWSVTNPFAVTGLQAQVQAGVYNVELSSTTVTFDNVNTVVALISGSSPAVSSASGTLGLSSPVSGTSAATSSGNGTIGQIMAVAGSSAAASSASGAITMTMALSGTGLAVSSANGAITATLAVSGSGVSASSATGTLGMTGAIAGSGSSASSANGTIAAKLAVAGSSAAVSSASGTIVQSGGITGSSAASSSASGAVTSTLSCAGSASAASSASGTVVAKLVLAGSGTSQSSASGALSATGAVTGVSFATSVATGTVGIVSPLAGSSATASSGSGAVTITVGAVTYPVAGTSSPLSAANGAVILIGVVAGSSATASLANGSISQTGAVAGSSAATSQATGTLGQISLISGASATASSANGVMGLLGVVSGTSAATSAGYGAVTRVTPLAGSGASASSGSGAVTIQTGAQTYPVAGSSVAASTASGAAVALLAVAGSAATQSSATGSLAGAAPLAGSAASTSSASGGVRALLAAVGSSVAASSASGSLSASGALSGAATASSAASGALSARLAVAGSAASASLARGWLLAAGGLSGLSITVSGADGAILPPFVAGALPPHVSAIVEVRDVSGVMVLVSGPTAYMSISGVSGSADVIEHPASIEVVTISVEVS